MRTFYRFINSVPVVICIALPLFALTMGCANLPKQIKFQYNLVEGETYRQKTVTQQTVKQEFQGEQQVVTNTIESVNSYKVISKSASSSELEVSYDTLDIHVNLPNQKMHFSSRGSFWRKDDLFSQVLNTMSGKKFNVKINNANGEIMEITGLGSLFENVLNQFQSGTGEQISSVMEMLNKSYGENAFRDAFEATNSYFTDKEIKEGDQWENKTSLSNVNGELVNNWELRKLEKKEAIIENKGKLLSDKVSKEVYVEGVSAKLNLSGTQSATLLVEHTSGWTKSGKINQHFKGLMELNDPATGEAVDLPIEMINVITYTTVE